MKLVRYQGDKLKGKNQRSKLQFKIQIFYIFNLSLPFEL